VKTQIRGFQLSQKKREEKKDAKIQALDRVVLVDSSHMFCITLQHYLRVILCFWEEKLVKQKHETSLDEDYPAVISVSQHTGTGSTGSGSLLLDHYVIGWAQFALFLLECEAEREPSVSTRREVKEACAVHSSRPPQHAALYKPKSIQTATVSQHF